MTDNYSNSPNKAGKQPIFKYFGLVPSIVLRDSAISFGAKAVYAYLATYVNAEQVREGKLCAWPSRKRMQKELNMSANTLSKYLKELKENKLIKIEQSRQTKDGKHFYGNNIYTLQQHIKHSDSKGGADDQFKRNPNSEQPDSYATQEIDLSVNHLPLSNNKKQSKNNFSSAMADNDISEPKPTSENSKTKEKDPLIDMIINVWNRLGVNPHPRLGPNTRNRIADALDTALQDFPIEEIINSMQIYASVFKRKGCHHKYRLVEFLEKKGYEHFTTESNWRRTIPEKLLREDFTYTVSNQDRSFFSFLDESDPDPESP